MTDKIKLNIADLERWVRNPITISLFNDLKYIKDTTASDSEGLIYRVFNRKTSDSEAGKELVAMGARNRVIDHVLEFTQPNHIPGIEFDKENLQ